MSKEHVLLVAICSLAAPFALLIIRFFHAQAVITNLGTMVYGVTIKVWWDAVNVNIYFLVATNAMDHTGAMDVKAVILLTMKLENVVPAQMPTITIQAMDVYFAARQ